jgi:hypothetical protein
MESVSGIVLAAVPAGASAMPFHREPQFRVGDSVLVVNPGVDKGKEGIVIEVTGHIGDFVYRYGVRFADGTSKRYFGFEIIPVLSQSA